jgi:protocatechuate 3,4-dioxygenase beta subunit
MTKLWTILIFVGLLISTGCAAVIIGAGAGAGTYAYIDGALKRAYATNYEKTYQVCMGILNDLKQPVIEKTTDGVQTTIKTERSDGTPMTVKVTILDPDRTEVSVRTGMVGLWKKDISEQYHKFVEERLMKK